MVYISAEQIKPFQPGAEAETRQVKTEAFTHLLKLKNTLNSRSASFPAQD